MVFKGHSASIQVERDEGALLALTKPSSGRAASRKLRVAAAIVMTVSGCTETLEAPRRSLPRGGTLRVNIVANPPLPEATPFGLDPQAMFSAEAQEVFRCCLLRNLLSYSGRPTGQGGALLRPDIATALPEVSSDGLTWTFRLKRGLRYGPPLTDTEIVAPDFVRSWERMARVGVNASYFSVIEGFDEVTSGDADAITGLETPNAHTLVVHLTKPTGNFGYRTSIPDAAPIPATPSGARVDAGHDDYGPFLVSSGPYAIEGSEALDFSLPPEEQQPVSGFRPGESLTLVRNPSWKAATDPLRPALVDRIEVSILETLELASAEVQRGDADVVLYPYSPPQVPTEIIDAYRTDPDLSDRLLFGAQDSIRYASINLGVPPFDDIHVRKAVNYAVNKSRLIDIRGGPVVGKVAGHIIHDSMENNLLLNYDPYATPEGRGDLVKAKAEIAQSRYDDNGDGVCDDPVCRGVLTVSNTAPTLPGRRLGESIASDLEPLGIQLDLRVLQPDGFFSMVLDPTKRVGLAINAGWGKAFPNAEDFVGPLFSRRGLEEGCCNYALVGATPRELRRWGYEVTSVPSVEEKVSECHPLIGIESIRCYAELDQLLMEQVVPWIPLVFQNHVYIVSRRVVAQSYDQFAALPALDRIAVAGGTS
jgi:peptide/nickel transport system substrate-binding protein